MTICCAFDALFPTMKNAVDIYNSTAEEPITFENLSQKNLYEVLDKQHADDVYCIYNDPKVIATLTPLVGAPYCVENIIRAGHRFVITIDNEFDTKFELIQKFFPFINIDNILRIPDTSLLKCDVLIDDDLDALVRSMVDRIAIAMPWNDKSSTVYAYDISRSPTWRGILCVIKTIETEHELW